MLSFKMTLWLSFGLLVQLFTFSLSSPVDSSSFPAFNSKGRRGSYKICPGLYASETDCTPPVTVLDNYDYVVVGSGPGGGTVAANLAVAGHKVLLLEAGDDQGSNVNYTVPLFSFKSSEDPKMSWGFFVDHYKSKARQQRDPKLTWKTPDGGIYVGQDPPEGSNIKGIFYPRGATLGGSAGHNALVLIYPQASDWNSIANLTNDASWNAENMRHYFEEIEDCQYLAPGTKGHGFDGWLSSNTPDLDFPLGDKQQLSMFKSAAAAAGTPVKTEKGLKSLLARDVNAEDPGRDSQHGLYSIPLFMNGNRRSSPREYLLATAHARNSDGTPKYHLDIRTNCLVTRIVFDESGNKPRATGVEFLEGEALYRADPRSSGVYTGGTPGLARASREVIISGGAFNTPQILKLSGIGPANELEKFNIPVVVDLPGVGTNLQDRYEASIVAKTEKPFTEFAGCTLGGPGDPCLADWESATTNKTIYATDGVTAGVLRRSSVASNTDDDLVIFGGPIVFRGYFPGYAAELTGDPYHFTWSVLKAHTGNRAGTVRLSSRDPRAMPRINFNFFDHGTPDAAGSDADAVVQGLQFARKIFRTEGRTGVAKYTEILPGADVKTADQLKQYAQDYSWGHHASCSCPIGADGDPMAVLDSRFNVRGTLGLRVVDASVFPHIPGIFVAAPVYIMAQKASHVIAEDASKHGWDDAWNGTKP